MPNLSDTKTPTLPLFVAIGCLIFSFQLTAKEYIIKPHNKLKFYNMKNFTQSGKLGLKIVDSIESLNLVKISVNDSADPADALTRAVEYFDADYIVLNAKLHAFLDFSDPDRASQWALNTVQAPQAWDMSVGSHDIVVAVVDTGVALTHEDLKDNIWGNANEIAGNGKDDDNNGFIDDVNGWDFLGKDNDPTDETSTQNPGHGTHCSGIIGAVSGNNVGVCGISPHVSIMPLRFLGSDGSGDLYDAVKAIDYAISNGAHIISASFGATVPESGAQPLIDAIKRAEEKGVIFVAAAGNEGHSNDTTNTYPANTNTSNMIAVAASDVNDQKPSWSNYGRKVHIASPGVDILSTIPTGYDKLSGTSMATPLIAGIVALMKSVDITLTGSQARSIIQSTGDVVSIDTESSRRVNAAQAVDAVRQKSLTLVPATATFEPGSTATFSAWGGVAPYQFSSQNTDIATIDSNGNFSAKAEGDVVIQVIDAANNQATSISVRVQKAKPAQETCPIDNEFLCMILCAIKPDLPWCTTFELHQ